MLKIRLQRTGRENIPTYRLVVADKRAPAKGRFLEVLGHYLPARNPVIFEHDDDRIRHWVQRGAIPSETVARLLLKAGLKEMQKYVTPYTKKRPKGEAPPEAPAAAPAAEKSDTPAN